MNVRTTWMVPVALALLAPGCIYDEGLIIENLQGTVSIPKEAATRTIVREDGSTEEITDVRLIGPVYLGLYPSVAEANVLERYPHPELGPQYLDDVPGDAYPYGGTTIGDLRFACIEDLTCLMVSGRYVDWNAIVDWFELVQQPLTDASGKLIPDGEYLKQTCYDLMNVTSDAETRITAYEDRNADGDVNELDLDFVEDGDFYTAEFTLWQQEHFWNNRQEDCEPGVDCEGMSLWAFVDMPATASFRFSTCDSTQGFQNNEYNNEFFGGQPFTDILNFPGQYISDGDYVVGEAYRWDNLEERPNLVLDYAVE